MFSPAWLLYLEGNANSHSGNRAEIIFKTAKTDNPYSGLDGEGIISNVSLLCGRKTRTLSSLDLLGLNLYFFGPILGCLKRMRKYHRAVLPQSGHPLNCTAVSARNIVSFTSPGIYSGDCRDFPVLKDQFKSQHFKPAPYPCLRRRSSLRPTAVRTEDYPFCLVHAGKPPHFSAKCLMRNSRLGTMLKCAIQRPGRPIRFDCF